MTLPTDPAELRLKWQVFFQMIFGPNKGYINIAHRAKSTWQERTFLYPDQLPNMLAHIETNYKQGNSYFCPQLLNSDVVPAGRRSARYKENIKGCTVAWADLDACSPDLCLVEPSVTVESSPGSWQAYWMFREPKDPEKVQDICQAIAYHHVPDGADKTGWDLTQLLRIPYTPNFKYDNVPMVQPRKVTRAVYELEDFDAYVNSRMANAVSKADPMPVMLPTESGIEILQRYRRSINPMTFSLHDVTPSTAPGDGGWSKILWQLIMLCYEAGMSREEVFVVASSAACNKYKRDGKNPRLLWEEVCRGYSFTVEKLNVIAPEDRPVQPLITDAELASIEGMETFVERYVKWASSLGDAAPQYHHAAAFMALSSLLSGAIRLPTSFGIIMPNLWFMILADTTLTRKSTAMDISMDLVEEVEPDVLLATDGSIEGLMTAMETRVGRPSVFLRDEFSGLLEAMARKDYYAGMAETFTKLYDGKTMKRLLRKETITVREPCLLIFAGGIKNRVQSLLTLDHVSSGFVPRFIFVTAESDVSKLRPLGPPTMQSLEDKDKLREELSSIRDRYVQMQKVLVKGALVGVQQQKFEARLTDDAWQRYNQLESTMLYAGVNADQPDIMTPVYDRLSKSALKAAVLIAASRMQPGNIITVELEDLLLALKYATHWRDYALEIVNGIGRSAAEAQMERVFRSIRSHPGVARSKLMQWYHLNAREAEVIFMTLEQRGLIVGTRMGKTTLYEPVVRVK